MTTKLNQLRELRNNAVKAMRDLHEAAEKESRGFTADELQNFNNARSSVDEIEARMKRETELSDAEARSAERVEGTRDDADVRAAMTGRQGADTSYDKAFRSYLVNGQGGLNTEERNLLAEKRDLSLTGASGGFTVPQGFLATLIEAQREYGAFLNPGVATILETDSGNPIPVPLEDDTANAASIVAEGVSLTTSTDATFANLTLGAFTYRSLVRVSLELLQDSAFDLEAYVARKLGIRLGRGFNGHASTGTGTGQPQGLFNATVGAPIGVTAPTGNTANFPYLSLVDLEHSVDPAYRANAQWMFSDGVLQALKRQLDGQQRPIWQPNYSTGTDGNSPFTAFPGTILGYRYTINQDAPTQAANARSIAFGDFSYYMARRVRNMMLVRADQRFIDQGQIGFYVFARMDGRYANPTAVAARAPIRLGQNSAT